MNYKHLRNEDIRKIENFRNFKTQTKKIISFFVCVFSIVLFALVGFFYFYNYIDYDKNIKTTGTKTAIEEKYDNTENKNLNHLEENQEEQKIIESKKKDEINSYDFKNWNEKAPEELKIINHFNSLEDFEPKLKIVAGKKINALMAKDLENMIESARKQDIKICISSGYRTYEEQKKIYESAVFQELIHGAENQEEAEKKALFKNAKPAHSEHNIGLAVDFEPPENNETKETMLAWILKHAEEFGFIQRYKDKWANITHTNDKPLHFRYVGIKNAQKINKFGKSLEEYVIKNQNLY
ncbi:MAG: M15 family metallopeptidase [Oscillospiraceae bacterium]|jgi:D-alanyl-D-alanine carboxypeptidase|nr:M15 family metallopeptidase [Oscillospiraceae bacterium]